MEWIKASEYERRDYECVLAAVPSYEGDELDHRLAMWDPENDSWTVFGANWHPQPTHVMPLPSLPAMSKREIATASAASIYSAVKDKKLLSQQSD
jgi:hypothetical protein